MTNITASLQLYKLIFRFNLIMKEADGVDCITTFLQVNILRSRLLKHKKLLQSQQWSYWLNLFVRQTQSAKSSQVAVCWSLTSAEHIHITVQKQLVVASSVSKRWKRFWQEEWGALQTHSWWWLLQHFTSTGLGLRSWHMTQMMPHYCSTLWSHFDLHLLINVDYPSHLSLKICCLIWIQTKCAKLNL